MNPLFSLLGLNPARLIDSVSNVIDLFVTTGAEKARAKEEVAKEINRHLETLENMDPENLKAQLNDMAGARQMNIEANNNDKSSWLARNITPLLAMIIIILTFALYGWIMLGGEYLKDRENVIFAVLGSLTTMAAAIISYYFGSSIGANKTKGEHYTTTE